MTISLIPSGIDDVEDLTTKWRSRVSRLLSVCLSVRSKDRRLVVLHLCVDGWTCEGKQVFPSGKGKGERTTECATERERQITLIYVVQRTYEQTARRVSCGTHFVGDGKVASRPSATDNSQTRVPSPSFAGKNRFRVSNRRGSCTFFGFWATFPIPWTLKKARGGLATTRRRGEKTARPKDTFLSACPHSRHHRGRLPHANPTKARLTFSASI